MAWSDSFTFALTILVVLLLPWLLERGVTPLIHEVGRRVFDRRYGAHKDS